MSPVFYCLENLLATLIDSAGYLLTCSRYIELNPVRTQRVGHPRFYPWSSYRWHAEGKTDPLMTDHRLYRASGKTAGERQRAYRELCTVPLAQESLVSIREAANMRGRLPKEVLAATDFPPRLPRALIDLQYPFLRVAVDLNGTMINRLNSRALLYDHLDHRLHFRGEGDGSSCSSTLLLSRKSNENLTEIL